MASVELTEDRQLLVRTAHDFVREKSPVAALRALRDSRSSEGFDRALYREMCELGLVGVSLPEDCGGAGLGDVELGLVLQELGRTLVASPIMSSVVLGAGALLGSGNDAHRTLLSQVAAGEQLLALAYNERHRHAPFHCETRAEATPTGYALSGRKTFVLDAHVADQILVVARTAGAVADRTGLSLFSVPRQTEGVVTERLGMVDSRGSAHVALERACVEQAALIGPLHGAADLLEPVFDRAAILLSAEMLGATQAAFEITLDYLKTRRQFGVPIGSFQALKHRAADLFAEIELSRSVVMDGLCALDAGRDDLASVASIVKARMSDVMVRVTADAIQLHGGIGMTDEHDIGLYYKRARVAELQLGDGGHHRDRFATLGGY